MKTLFGIFAILFMLILMTSCGPKGDQGGPGPAGPNGHNSLIKMVANNTACSNGGSLLLTGVDLNDDGILSASEVQQSANVCNGLNGIDGANPVLAPVIAITPCGPNSSSYKEVLLGLFGGGVFAEFTGDDSHANTVRNTLIPDGSYYNTDSSQCNFSVSTSGSGRTVSWNGSSHNSSGTYNAGSAVFNSSANTWTATY